MGLVFVEDYHGVDFHNALIKKLIENSFLSKDSMKRITVKRMPSKKCNPALRSKVSAVVNSRGEKKVLMVIDSEGHRPNEAKHLFIERHFRSQKGYELRVAVLEPKHEAWLCIGLTGKKRTRGCRHEPEAILSRMFGRPYEKHMLGEQAHNIDLEWLIGERDFKEYFQLLIWVATATK